MSELAPRLEAEETHALVSDAGLPGVNDPGTRLVEAARAAGVEVSVLPGPSAVETALVASGLSTGPYRFLGYLPRRETEPGAVGRRAHLALRRRGVRVASAPSASLALLAAIDPGVQRPCAAS